MYAGRFECCPVVTHSVSYGTDRRTDAIRFALWTRKTITATSKKSRPE